MRRNTSFRGPRAVCLATSVETPVGGLVAGFVARPGVTWARQATVACLLIVCGCAGTSSPPDAPVSLSALSGARFRWVETSCVDGPLDLAPLGFERELFTDVVGNRIQMTFDTRIIRDGCRAVLAWEAAYDRQVGHYRFVAPGRVVLPYDQECGVAERGEGGGMLGIEGDRLELITHQSPWCRGFDARAVYRRMAPRPLNDQERVLRYAVHFARRDARGLGALFAGNGVLVEPFGRTDDGTMKRHVGRDAVTAWFQQAFATTAWSDLRLRDVYQADVEDGTWVASWDYMDSALAEPVRGRNLFLLVDGAIFMSEVQLVTPPVPAPAPSATQAPG